MAKKAAGKKKTAGAGKGFKEIVPKSPRARQLPEMEDEKVQAIEDAALDYADVRDRRMQLTPLEVDAKSKVADAMHKAGKTEYRRGDIVVTLTAEKEKVKVRIKSGDADGEGAEE